MSIRNYQFVVLIDLGGEGIKSQYFNANKYDLEEKPGAPQTVKSEEEVLMQGKIGEKSKETLVKTKTTHFSEDLYIIERDTKETVAHFCFGSYKGWYREYK